MRAGELAAKAVPDVAVTTELVPEAPRFTLREQAAEVVVGHRGHDGFAGLLLGSTGLSLAGRTSCPLVIVRGDTGDERDEVVAGVDLRDGESERVLAYAFEAASLRGTWVRIVHTWEVPPALSNGPHIGSVSHGVIHHADCPVAVIAASTTQTV